MLSMTFCDPLISSSSPDFLITEKAGTHGCHAGWLARMDRGWPIRLCTVYREKKKKKAHMTGKGSPLYSS
jgi:hypothetical protein